ncbi:MAG: hypothetical protein ACKO4R_12930 [Synechococcales cyanobacterium]
MVISPNLSNNTSGSNGGSLVSAEPEKDVKPATTPLMDGGSLVEGEDTTEDGTRRRRRRPSSVVEDSI